MSEKPYETQIAEYGNLLTHLYEVEGLRMETRSPRISLAFLIEEMKNKNPEGWQKDLENLRREIDEMNKKEGRVGVTWFIAEHISTTYMDFLNRRKEECNDETLKHNLDIMKQMTEDDLMFVRKSHQEGKPVGFGGVSIDYTPKWYYYTDI